MNIEERAQQFRESYGAVREEIRKRIVGMEEIVDCVIDALFLGGHVLLEGVPGLGKTLLVRSLAESLDLTFSRIQFTPDLMPADILGTSIIIESAPGQKSFRFQRGPVFTHILLADEINRATPKTQSALLEAMQERSVTVGGERNILEEPFYRAGHSESHRDGRHLSVARGAAGSIPVQAPGAISSRSGLAVDTDPHHR